MDWVIKELVSLNLGDKRLNVRAQKILEQLSCNPTDSIPVACAGAAETKATYRFFDNDHVTPEKIQEAHLEATYKRMAGHPVVLIPQDTTMLNFSKQDARNDVGPTMHDLCKGMYLHSAIAVTPEKICLGVVSYKRWHRENLQRLSKRDRTRKNYLSPLEAKESYRWLENYRQVDEIAQQLPTTMVVSMADREGDIYDIYKEANEAFSKQGPRAHYLIRAKHNRSICTAEGKRTTEKIKSTLMSEKALGEISIQIQETRKRKSRTACLAVYSRRIFISLPDKIKKEKDYKPVEITAVLCTERHPPEGSKAIEWLLITDLEVNDFREACEKIEWYTCRWQIEVFFKVLKSGCTIEKLQLTDKNFLACLNFYMIIAWRILYVVAMGRCCPDKSCEYVYSREEWQTTYVIIHKKRPPEVPPSLNEMTRMVASLGGFLNRKSDPEPGVKTIWIGMRNMQEHIRAKEAFEAVYGNICG